METILEVLSKIADGTVSFGAIVQALLAGLGGFYASKKLNGPKQ